MENVIITLLIFFFFFFLNLNYDRVIFTNSNDHLILLKISFMLIISKNARISASERFLISKERQDQTTCRHFGSHERFSSTNVADERLKEASKANYTFNRLGQRIRKKHEG